MATVLSGTSQNPASTSLFPGRVSGGGHVQFRVTDEDRDSVAGVGSISRSSLGVGRQSSISRELFAVSLTEHKPVKSSHSSPSQDRCNLWCAPERNGSPSDFQLAVDDVTGSLQSPVLGGLQDRLGDGDSARGFKILQRPLARDLSISAIPEVPPDGDDTLGMPRLSGLYQQHAPYVAMMRSTREQLHTVPMLVGMDSRTSSFTSAQTRFVSSSESPVSSLESGGMFSPGVDLSTSFDAQLKSSSLIHRTFARVDRYGHRIERDENRTKELEGLTLGIVHKVDLERVGTFASSSAPSFSTPDLKGLSGSRASIVDNISPNQPCPIDDITALAGGFGSLCAAAEHCLGNMTQGMPPNNILPRDSLVPSNSSPGVMGYDIPNRPSLHIPGPPSWARSAGNLDIPPLRGGSDDSPAGGLKQAYSGFRDQRRSVSANMLRRDSSATDVTNSSGREIGPTISKWDQLALAPELLRSLNAFGVGPPNKIQQRALPFLLKGADIIAQAPPTQERIAAYVIPAIHIALIHAATQIPLRGPLVIMILTTVDQATRVQRMVCDIGGPAGVRSALGVGATSVIDELGQELRLLRQNMPHILCGTPQKLHALFTGPGAISGAEARFLVLDEVDQLIARNLQDFVFTIVKMLPPPKSRSGNADGNGLMYSIMKDNGSMSSLNPSSLGRTFSTIGSAASLGGLGGVGGASISANRQIALFTTTVPKDVLNLAATIEIWKPVRVLARRHGSVTHTGDGGPNTCGLRQFYLYLAFTAGGGYTNATLPQQGLGIIGSGRRASTSAKTTQAPEWKLDALANLFDNLDVSHAIVHVGGTTALESVMCKLGTRSMDVVPLHHNMNADTKLAALNVFRSPSTVIMQQMSVKVLVVYDVVVRSTDVQQVPLVINYDMPKAVEEYAHRVAPAIATNASLPGVVLNFVTATGGDVEMLHSIECFYKFRCPEVPNSLCDIIY